MKNDSFYVIEEYLREGDPRVQKNALIALSAISDNRSIEKLIEIALNHDSTDLRKEALNLLNGLNADQIQIFAEKLQNINQKKLPLGVFGLKDILERNSINLKLNRSFIIRIQDYFSIRALLYPKRDLNHFFRNFRFVLQSSIIGTFLFTLFFWILHFFNSSHWETDPASYLIISPLISITLCLIYSYGAFPIYYRLDNFSVSVFIFILILLGSISPILITMFILWGYEITGWAIFWATGYAFISLGLASRFGTILTHHIIPNKLVSWLVSTLAGSLLSIIALSLMPLFSITTHFDELKSLWGLLSPSTVALSSVFARIDIKAPMRTSKKNTKIKIFFLFILMISSILYLGFRITDLVEKKPKPPAKNNVTVQGELIFEVSKGKTEIEFQLERTSMVLIGSDAIEDFEIILDSLVVPESDFYDSLVIPIKIYQIGNGPVTLLDLGNRSDSYYNSSDNWYSDINSDLPIFWDLLFSNDYEPKDLKEGSEYSRRFFACTNILDNLNEVYEVISGQDYYSVDLELFYQTLSSSIIDKDCEKVRELLSQLSEKL